MKLSIQIFKEEKILTDLNKHKLFINDVLISIKRQINVQLNIQIPGLIKIFSYSSIRQNIW